MDFHKQRRQQFLGEARYVDELARLPDSIAYFAKHPVGSGTTPLHRDMLARLTSAEEMADWLVLRYTAGEPITPLRAQMDQVVAAYERYATSLWQFRDDRNESALQFDLIDDYAQLMQLIGLCFLLHRRDLLPRIAAFQDGADGKGNGGCDTLYEEFMAFGVGPETRFETEMLCQLRPYEDLFNGLTETTPARGLAEIDRFLKHWYKDLAGTGWHDSHKPDEHGNQGGYYGYWSFEAGAAVLLLGIEDDSSLHKYLYYPKDMVAWARAHKDLGEPEASVQGSLRCEAGQRCPRGGWWFTPAQPGSRRRFQQGETMPDLKSAWGATIWQWDSVQDGESA